MGVVFLLGFFFDWIETTLIVLPVFGPVVGKLDFGTMFATVGDQTLWFAMLVAINLQTSFLTPAFGCPRPQLKGQLLCRHPPQLRRKDRMKEWNLSSMDSVGGHETEIVGSPRLIATDTGRAVEFDGVGDGPGG